MYNSIQDAETVLLNSGVLEMFNFDDIQDVAPWMYNNDATPEEAVAIFGAA